MKASPLRATPSLFELTAGRLRRLAEATGSSSQAENVVAVYARLIEPWGHLPAGDRPAWLSYIGDDHTPIEFSVTFSKTPELRILFEPLGSFPSVVSNRDAALRLLRAFSADYRLDLARFERIRDLFCPPDPQGTFGVWLAVAFPHEGPPEFKIYLNPAAQGRSLAPAVVEEALVRLGFHSAWASVSRGLLRRGREFDELNYVSLDLSAAPDARVKIYARHSSCTVADLERAAQPARDHRAGDVRELVRILAPRAGDGALEGRAPSTCYTFVGSDSGRPAAATTHFPINSYAASDREVAGRVLSLLRRFDVSAEGYKRAIAGFATRRLDAAVGMHSYVSFRRYRDEARITTYLATEAYKPGTVECAESVGESGVIQAARVDRRSRIANHPLCRRLLREPCDRGRVELLRANIEAARLRGNGSWGGDRTPDARGRELEGAVLSAGLGLCGQLSELGSLDSDERAGATTEAAAWAEELDGFVNRLTGASNERPGQRPTLPEMHAKSQAKSHAVSAACWTGARRVERAVEEFLDDLYVTLYGSQTG